MVRTKTGFARCEKRLCRNHLFPEDSPAAVEQKENISGRSQSVAVPSRTIGCARGMGNFVFCSPRRRRGNGDGCCLSRGKVADRYAVGQPLTGGKAQRDFSRKGRIHQCRCAARFRPLLRLSVLCPRIYPQPTEKPPESLLTARFVRFV